MRKVHFISIGDTPLYHLALALKERGYDISGSGENIMNPAVDALRKAQLLPETEGWFPGKLDKKTDFVILPDNVDPQNPELLRAKELGLLTLTFGETVNRLIKNKIRVVICGEAGDNRILSIILYALKQYKLLCDFAAVHPVKNSDRQVRLGYDARMVLLEGETPENIASKKGLQYSPHILIIPHLKWQRSETFPTSDKFYAALKKGLNTIERDGKVIFNADKEEEPFLENALREDLTAISFKEHKTIQKENKTYLSTRFGDFPLENCDSEMLCDINAALLACRQMGLNDKEFYDALQKMEL